VDTLPMKKP